MFRKPHVGNQIHWPAWPSRRRFRSICQVAAPSMCPSRAAISGTISFRRAIFSYVWYRNEELRAGGCQVCTKCKHPDDYKKPVFSIQTSVQPLATSLTSLFLSVQYSVRCFFGVVGSFRTVPVTRGAELTSRNSEVNYY